MQRICSRGVTNYERFHILKLNYLEEKRVIFNIKTLFKIPLNDNVALLSTYFISFHSMQYYNYYKNIFTKSSFVISI